MPFIAVDPVDNRPRIPVGVGDDEEVQCPKCNDMMSVREGSRTRHFYHPADPSCNGESSLHLRMKSIAVEKLTDEYPNASIRVEFVTDDVPRRADVFVEFEQPQFPFGKGIAVEVQYRNDQKDLTETTVSYLTADISVIWLFEENYVGTRPEYEDVELPDPIPVWPYSVPHGDTPSPDSSPGEYLDVTERDLVAFLPNHVDDQISLGEFRANSDTTEKCANTAEWAREKELNLNLSITSPGVQEVYKSWLQSRIQSLRSEHRTAVEERSDIVQLETRPTSFSSWFNEGPGETFSLTFRVNRTNVSQFTVRKIVDGTEVTTLFDENDVESFIEFVLNVGYELECSRISTPGKQAVRQSVKSHLSNLSYSITPTWSETVTVELNSSTETIHLEFCPEQMQSLLDLCAKIQLWYDLLAHSG
ncbi:competence protein CoiA family protein [Natranaeroarchaeum sulfidigenes]|nr:competence protein CoiA family protein [Natranaeroarchaeum sulfidigenes]